MLPPVRIAVPLNCVAVAIRSISEYSAENSTWRFVRSVVVSVSFDDAFDAELASELAATRDHPERDLPATFRGDIAFNDLNLRNAGFNDIFVARYDPNGELDWVRQIGGPGDDAASAITTAKKVLSSRAKYLVWSVCT